MQIQFGEWQICSFRPEDAPALAKYGNNRAIWRNLWDQHPYPYGVADAEEWIAAQERLQGWANHRSMVVRHREGVGAA